ncbi:MAG: hypothetical protein IPH44_33535 [Myxococcales bacterium]|nr:hypothetical protein [Myxococcales bacterium]
MVPRSTLDLHRVAVAAATVALAACASRARPAPRGPEVTRLPTPSVKVGECARPEHDGAMSAHPDRQRADRDLDGDGQPETVIADRQLCQGDNCYWNVFVRGAGDECERFAGVIAGAALEPGPASPGTWPEVRGLWGLGGDRLLIHSYQFRRGGYQLTEALLCRRVADDRVLCAETDGDAGAP